MRRSKFIAAILGMAGIAKAQRSFGECVYANGLRCTINGKCPTCGAMAEPYRREMYVAGRTCKPATSKDDPTKSGLMECAYEEAPGGPMERVIRCRRCNAAFYQDAEPSK